MYFFLAVVVVTFDEKFLTKKSLAAFTSSFRSSSANLTKYFSSTIHNYFALNGLSTILVYPNK